MYGICRRSIDNKDEASKIPQIKSFDNDDLIMLNKFTENLEKIRQQIDKQNINFYIGFIVSALFEANKYFNDQEPWKKKR